ncbi:uncharacterized protein METZ01_LOCUS52918 [marine metagenome]|uniref:Uncharacterized protein n=1 Tax=marine metagenome TaxID=408172 RepID=A0A381S994_9ZZZZ
MSGCVILEFRQSPPILCFSIKATLALIADAVYELASSPEPVPMTMIL